MYKIDINQTIYRDFNKRKTLNQKKCKVTPQTYNYRLASLSESPWGCSYMREKVRRRSCLISP